MRKNNDVLLGKAKVSKDMTFSLIREVRPHLNAQPGDHIEFVSTDQGIIIRREVKSD
jgi:hypothetical protein